MKFSGPIRKGRAWFSNSTDAYYTVSTISGLPGGQNSQLQHYSQQFPTRVQWNITNAQILTGSFLPGIKLLVKFQPR